jgi:hypothetical protein
MERVDFSLYFGFKILPGLKSSVILDIKPCISTEVVGCLRWICWLHLQSSRLSQSKKSACRLCLLFASCWFIALLTLTVEAKYSSVTSLDLHRTNWRYIPEDTATAVRNSDPAMADVSSVWKLWRPRPSLIRWSRCTNVAGSQLYVKMGRKLHCGRLGVRVQCLWVCMRLTESIIEHWGYGLITHAFVTDEKDIFFITDVLNIAIFNPGLVFSDLHRSFQENLRMIFGICDNSLLPSYYLLTYGAEPFLRSCQLCSHSENSQQF